MKISQAKQTIKFCYSIKEPLFLHSSPGIGKSSIANQCAVELAAEMKVHFDYIDMRCADKDASEIGSVLYIDGDLSKFTKPDWIPTEGYGIIILDELASAPLLVQAALYQLILDRELGGVKLGDNWYIIAAGNLITDKAVGGRLSTALANRFLHIDIEPDVEETAKYAIEQTWHPVIAPLLRFKPELLMDFDPRKKEYAFASPRTWEKTSNVLKGKPSRNIRYELLEGTIGAGPAAELESFLQVHETLPNIEQLLKDPMSVEVPKEVATQYALVGAIGHKVTKDNFDNALVYAQRMPADFQVLLVRDCITKDTALATSKSFAKWATVNRNFVIA